MKRYYLRIWIFAIIAIFLSISVANAIELRFNNPPETSPIIPDGGWVYDYPYQRNVIIDFGWDPGAWMADANVPGVKELSPSAENYFFAGFDDPTLYDPDWFSFSANFEHYWIDSLDLPPRYGFIGILNRENSEVTFTIYLNNDPIEHPVKHIWVEMEYYLSGDFSLLHGAPAPNPPASLTDWAFDSDEYLGDGWFRRNAWYQIEPNPTGEQLTWTLSTSNSGTVLIDYIHIATESVDTEPSCSDTYEPDDDSIQATELFSGVPQTHSICPVGDQDWYHFSIPPAVNQIPGPPADDVDTSPATVVPVTVGLHGIIADLDLYVNLSARWAREVNISLRHNGVTVQVHAFQGITSSGDFIDATFDDEAGAGYPPGGSLNGTFQPSPDALSAFEGMDVFGLWELILEEGFGFPDDGTDLLSWSINVAYDHEVVLETSDTSADTRMWLYDSGVTAMDFDDNSGAGLFSRIDRVCGVDALPQGNYFAEVDEFGDNDEIESYNMSLTVEPCATCPVNPGSIFELVSWYYVSILDRSPEPGGAESWTAEIQRIVGLGIDVKEGFIALGKLFFNSGEYLSKDTTDVAYIIDLYETFLGRTPSPGEVAVWEAELAGGLPRNLLLNYFTFAEEFRIYMDGLFGACLTRPEYTMVNDLYRGFLARLPDDGGFNSWLALMQEAQCTGPEAVRALAHEIALSFLRSAEYEARGRNNGENITDLYDGILRRGAELAGYLAWVATLDSGMSREQALQHFVESLEFQGLVDEVIAAGCVLP